MKLIAMRDFRNVAILGLKEPSEKDPTVLVSKLSGVQHDDHVHKGCLFEIGAAKDLKGLQKLERDKAVIVASLIAAGVAGEADDPKVVQSVKDEVEVDRKREARVKELDTRAQLSGLGQQVISAMGNMKSGQSRS